MDSIQFHIQNLVVKNSLSRIPECFIEPGEALISKWHIEHLFIDFVCPLLNLALRTRHHLGYPVTSIWQ